MLEEPIWLKSHPTSQHHSSFYKQEGGKREIAYNAPSNAIAGC